MIVVVVCANHYVNMFASGPPSEVAREASAVTSINKARKPTAFEVKGIPPTNIQGDKSVGMAHNRYIILFKKRTPTDWPPWFRPAQSSRNCGLAPNSCSKHRGDKGGQVRPCRQVASVQRRRKSAR